MNLNKIALVILNGEKPSNDLIGEFWHKADLRVCADGAAETLLTCQLEPDIIIGDFDSLPLEAVNRFPVSKIVRKADQHTTDGEKAFQYCIDRGVEKILVLGALGGERIDHGLYNLGLMRKYLWSGVKITLFTENEEVTIINQKECFSKPPGTRISLLPIFGKVSKVTTKGLDFPLQEANLELGNLCSISNKFLESEASVDLTAGELLVLITRKPEQQHRLI